MRFLNLVQPHPIFLVFRQQEVLAESFFLAFIQWFSKLVLRNELLKLFELFLLLLFFFPA